MYKDTHEIRDPIHVFICVDSDERKVINSRPFQRLRNIHQLALTYLVYPGVTHKRFEHSLGVMELAGRVYDIVTNPDYILDNSVKSIIPAKSLHYYWRRVIRMAALCHDLGHLPFSHVADDLLPNGVNHEDITLQIIKSEEMESVWKEIKIQSEDVAKLVAGPKKLGKDNFSNWEAIVSEIVIGNAFGVDRIDYLLRDSHHAGVAYGKFDHYRLIDCLRILPEVENSKALTLGITAGGLHSVEALLLARYFMFIQVYFHPIRRIYDIHLKDFLKVYLPGGQFPINVKQYLQMTDNEILVDIAKAAEDNTHPGYASAQYIVERKHFKLLYERNPNDIIKNANSVRAIYNAACKKFGEQSLRLDMPKKESGATVFPVCSKDNRIISSQYLLLDKLKDLTVTAEYVFIEPKHTDTAREWLRQNLDNILTDRI